MFGTITTTKKESKSWISRKMSTHVDKRRWLKNKAEEAENQQKMAEIKNCIQS